MLTLLPPRDIQDVTGHPDRRGVHHLTFYADRATPGRVGLLVGGYHFLRPLDFLLGRRKMVVYDSDLGRVDAPFAIEAQRACEQATLSKSLLVAMVRNRAVHGANA